ALVYHSGSDARTLRDALGCFATGVTVVTTRDGAGLPVGLTANSFSAVSLDPPLILFCLARSSSNLDRFRAAEHFAINVL
ncbi:flavin reductase family protein, partial [Salmonella enterica]|uniref:flavin reductase family protein n=2 Tax=Pseudomonadota TaxID=1224 RepID=UPI0020C56089